MILRSKKQLKTYLLWGFKITLTFFLIYFIFQKYIDTDAFIGTIKKISLIYLPLLTIIVIVNRLIMAYQVKFGLRIYQIYTSTFRVLKIQFVSVFYSMFLPGDLVAGAISWHLLSKDTGKRAQVAAILAYIRMLNLLTLLPFAIVGLISEPFLIHMNLHVPIIAVGILLVLAMLPFIWPPATFIGERISRWVLHALHLKRLESAAINLWQSIHICTHMATKNLIIIIALSFGIQFIGIVILLFMSQIAGIILPITMILWLRALITMIHLLPFTLAGIGVREISLLYILQEFYSVEPEKALLLSSLIFVFIFVLVALPGAIFTLRLKKQHQQEGV